MGTDSIKIHLSKRTFVVFEWLMILSILSNLLFWLDFGPMVYFAIVSLSLIIISAFSKRWCSNKGLYFIVILILLTLLLIDQSLFLDGIGSAITKGTIFFLGIGIFSLRTIYKKKLLNTVTKAFGVLLGLSLMLYIAFLFLEIPPFGILKEPFGYPDHYNFILFIVPCDFLIPRFSGPFIEPGHMAIFCCFILYANKFKFKQKKILYVYLFATLISLSLAGYVLLTVSLLFTVRIRLITILTIICTVTIGFITITYIWEGGDNPVYQLIFKRLEYDENKGVSGNNRSLYGTDDYFKNILNGDKLALGLGAKKYGNLQENNIIGGAGYKVYLIQYGILGTLLAFFYYLTIAWASFDKKYSLHFLLLIMICFIQRSYPEWIAWLLPYICGCRSVKPYKEVEIKQPYSK